MRPIQIITPSFSAASPTALAASQSLAGAGSLTLTAAAGTLSPPTRVTITSAGNDSARTITITGLSPAGFSQTESLAGGNAAAVTSVLTYSSVTSIAFSGATASTVTAGQTQSGYSAWLPMDIYSPNQVVTVSASVSGTINYSIEYTNENPFDTSRALLAVAHPTAGLTNATTNQTASSTALMRALRYVVNSGSGTLLLTIVQQSTV